MTRQGAVQRAGGGTLPAQAVFWLSSVLFLGPPVFEILI